HHSSLIPFVSLRVPSWINFFLGALAMLLATAARGQTFPATKPSASDFELHEWVVLVCSQFQPKANQDGLVLSTFPPSAQSRRQSAPAENRNDPQPMGVIRLVGASSAQVDVKIGIHNGRTMAVWP